MNQWQHVYPQVKLLLMHETVETILAHWSRCMYIVLVAVFTLVSGLSPLPHSNLLVFFAPGNWLLLSIDCVPR